MRTGLGPTPLREGMSRLVASGLVKAIDQRGFMVARIERFDIDDYTAYRLLLEQEAMRQSIEHGDNRWRDGLLAAIDLMAGYEVMSRESRRDSLRRYSDTHSEFHVALVSACPSPRLKANLDLLFDLEKFYCHNLVAADKPFADLVGMHSLEEHRELADVVLAGEADRAAALLAAHQWRLAGILSSRL